MSSINIEEIASLPEEHYMTTLLPKSGVEVTVKCFDGEVKTTFGLLAYAWAYMEYNRVYGLPVSSNQIPTVGSIPDGKLHFTLLNTGLRYTYDALDKQVELTEISKLGLTIMEYQINGAIEHLESYSMTIDAEDYFELETNEEILKLKQELREGVSKHTTSGGKFVFIQKAWLGFKNTLGKFRQTKLLHNGLSQLLLTGAKLPQLNQGVMSLGFRSDVNSDFFSTPVIESFADGLKDPYSFAIETCSGSKAAMYQKDSVGKTEYLHRLVQMLAASFQRLYLDDCGSKVTYPMTVKESYLPFITGKYYLDDSGVPVEITVDSTHLIGKTLNIRFVAGCQVDDEVGACSVCCGSTSLNIPKGANLGHTASTKFMGTGSQKVLSVKHEDLTALSMGMLIRDCFMNKLVLDDNNREVRLLDNNHYLLIPEKTAKHIIDIFYVNRVEDLNLMELSKVNTIELESTDEENLDIPACGPVGNRNEIVHLAPALLNYLRDDPRRMEIIPSYKRTRYYRIDLREFKVGDPLFLTPFKHFDMLIQHKLTKRFLYSTKADDEIEELGPKLTDFNTFGEAATALLELTMDKLGINLSLLEMTIYPFTINDGSKFDFRPVRNSNTCEFMPLMELYNNRSIAAKLVSEQQITMLKSPTLITNLNRTEHPFEDLFIE